MISRYSRHLWDNMSQVGRKTFPWDLVRGIIEGCILALFTTFALLVAIKYFDATVLQKTLVVASFAIGMLFSTVYASWAPVLGERNVQGSLPALGIAAGVLVAAWTENAWVYTAGCMAGGICSRLSLPVLIGLYRTNYKGRVRGQVFGVSMLLTVLMTLMVNYLGGQLLDQALTNYRYLYTGIGILALVGGAAIYRMPAPEVNQTARVNFLNCFSAVRENPLFGYMLGAWFLFGSANLILVPQRIEYLSQSKYGFGLGPGTVALIAGVAMEAGRLPMILVWARLFDKFNFIHLRMILNTLLIAYMILYFQTSSVAIVVVASVVLGVAYAGGFIAWNLWVTKFAPPEDTAKYMASHTFLTGIRGTVAPYIGYQCVEHFGISTTGWISVCMVLGATLMLWPIRKLGTRPKIPDQSERRPVAGD